MATVSNSVDVSNPHQENEPIRSKSDHGIQNETVSNPTRQRLVTMTQATSTATLATNMIKLESSAISEPTTSSPNSPNKQDAQTAVNTAHATPPGRTKLQPLESGLDVSGADLLNTTHADVGDSWTTRNSPAPSPPDHTQFKRPSPEQVSSIFPSELPPRPLPKRSFLLRLVDLPTHPAHLAHINEAVSNGYNLRTPDIELGVLGGDEGHHDTDRLRRLKFWVLILFGVVLSMGIGLLIYSLVRNAEETKMK